MQYKCLKNQKFQVGSYQIVPIRDEDKYLIRQWRNEQIYHLRQATPLSIEAQEAYFKTTVAALFDQEKPNQILFSYLEKGICIGYGGLVHINWVDKHAEISFIINTALEKDFFEFHWRTYLSLIEEVAFKDLNFHKIFTFGFDVRPHLYPVVEKQGFKKEAVLKQHYYWEGKFIDAIIQTKFNDYLSLRLATEKDVLLYFNWANEEQVRKQSFNSKPIDLPTHIKWFNNKLTDTQAHLFVCENEQNQPVGQVRIEQNSDAPKAIIGVSVDEKYRGQGLAPKILRGGIQSFLTTHKDYVIEAYIKKENLGSIKSFMKAGFVFEKALTYQDAESLLFIYKID